jgi:hypothetical protein
LVFYATSEGGNLVNFYKHNNVTMHYVKKVSDMKCEPGKICLWALNCEEVRKNLNIPGKIIYDNCPNWISYINFNDWVDRSGLFRVYQINESKMYLNRPPLKNNNLIGVVNKIMVFG